MSSSDVESQPSTGRGGSIMPVGISRKWKIVLAAAFLLGAVAVVGVCATAVGLGVTATTSGRSMSEEGINKEARSLGGNGEKENGFVRNRRIPSNARPADTQPSSSCYSEETNNTLPAAHIKGTQFEWESDEDFYQPQWDCDGTPAYVTGGMWFNQDQKSLYVPKCGWYYVSSEIAFQNNGDSVESYSYTLRIHRNCGESDDRYFRKGNTVNSPVEGTQNSLTSIQINDVVKICRGGRIYVNIPVKTNGCCPRGYSETTSLTAHLLTQSDCYWAVTSYTDPREGYQRPPQS
jgi:hypothetical protein